MQNRKKAFISIIIDSVRYAIVILIFICLSQFIVTHVIMNAYIPSASMEPGLEEGDYIIGTIYKRKNAHRNRIGIHSSQKLLFLLGG